MTTSRSKKANRKSPSKRQRPTAPSFDVGPRTQDTLAPVSGPIEPEVAQVAERLTVPDAPFSLGLHEAPRAAMEESALDHAFFASEAEAVARAHAEEIAEEIVLEPHPAPPISREVLRRRQSLRKVVSAVVGLAAVASLFAGVRFASARSRSVVDVPVAVIAPRSDVVLGVRAVAPVKAAPAPEPVTPVVTAPSHPETQAPPSHPETPVTMASDAKDLTKRSLSALERGKYADAIDLAKQSIDADPTDANPYLYLGTALLETGKRGEAKAAFGACVDTATRGPKADCRQFR
jgi:hypothetical protein